MMTIGIMRRQENRRKKEGKKRRGINKRSFIFLIAEAEHKRSAYLGGIRQSWRQVSLNAQCVVRLYLLVISGNLQ
eukprot:2880846-Pyramimonas_sp.AAC.1